VIDLSIVVPGIRPNQWLNHCESAKRSATKLSLEFIFVGPYDLPEEVASLPNITFIKSLSSPAVCMQLGVAKAVGEYTFMSSDDITFRDGTIDKCFEILESNGKAYKTIVSCKYTEGMNDADIKNHYDPNYYRVNGARCTKSRFIPQHWWILNASFLKTEYYIEIGGYDCRFEATALAMTDLGNRMQRDGAVVHLPEFFLMDVKPSEGPGDVGDHGPVYYAMTENDFALYKRIYGGKKDRDGSCTTRTKIDYDNWKQCPEVWPRRKF
jgi:hypothetical protein